VISEVKNIDCIIGMKEFPDKFFDLAIVDPPYGIGNWWKKNTNTKYYCDKKWNNKIPSAEYFKELFRVSKNQIIWGGNYFTDHLPVTNSWIVWDKLMNDNPTSDCELAWTSFKIKMTKITVRWSGALKDEKEFKRIHPSQRPVKLHDILLQKFAHGDQKILDTHLGSGSSRISAYNAGFGFWGFELDKDYFEAQEQRFQNHIAQQKIEF
jgi:site-specific DNA-methyltransferase (adenine-specific)